MTLRNCILFFLAMFGLLTAHQIPEIPDPSIVPMTFLEQERAVVLQHLKNTNFKGNETILHLGCRDGYLSNEIAKYLPEGHIVGLENTFAEEPQIGSDNISFLQGKFVGQGWENRYDYIICTQFDEWDDNPYQLFDAMRCALKPGGVMILLTCTDTALPAANPLNAWLRNPENPEYAPYLQFWSHVKISEYRTLWKKFPDICSVFGHMSRMITCFRNIEQFKEESRKWFRKIALLPTPLQEISLDHLCTIINGDKRLKVKGVPYYLFIYNLDIRCYRKKV